MHPPRSWPAYRHCVPTYRHTGPPTGMCSPLAPGPPIGIDRQPLLAARVEAQARQHHLEGKLACAGWPQVEQGVGSLLQKQRRTRVLLLQGRGTASAGMREGMHVCTCSSPDTGPRPGSVVLPGSCLTVHTLTHSTGGAEAGTCSPCGLTLLTHPLPLLPPPQSAPIAAHGLWTGPSCPPSPPPTPTSKCALISTWLVDR